MKLIFVDPQNDSKLFPDYIKTQEIKSGKQPFNFYSILDYGIRVDGLIPNESLYNLLRACEFGNSEGDSSILEFDKQYFMYLFTNGPSFKDLMRIVSTFDDDGDTIVMSNYTNPLVMPIVESLMKVISVRYGKTSHVINTVDDVEGVLSIHDDIVKDEPYLENYFNDTERYTKEFGIPVIPNLSPKRIEEDWKSLKQGIGLNTNGGEKLPI